MEGQIHISEIVEKVEKVKILTPAERNMTNLIMLQLELQENTLMLMVMVMQYQY